MCAWVTVIVVVAGVAVLIFLYKCVVGTSEVGWMRMDGWMDGWDEGTSLWYCIMIYGYKFEYVSERPLYCYNNTILYYYCH